MHLLMKIVAVLSVIMLQGRTIECKAKADVKSAQACPTSNPQAVCVTARSDKKGKVPLTKFVSLRKGVLDTTNSDPTKRKNFSCLSYVASSLDSDTLLSQCCTDSVKLTGKGKDGLTQPVPKNFNDGNCIGTSAAVPARGI
ncbi:hypothetical protein MJO28_006308 [Puccinia striiformis f. sp. tritici]|uniref:Hydrophobin n=4 Tax=Puccinia striiformis TaxID=27350 RepID=A0A0L0V050_9BASI|nr:hypothetical protein Pst134EA_011487 [Puccinia striiformis f. sp. tritici]KAI9605075.1 hypothetical protein H4Q26_003046 [Puccinia striiformis f. sp. tritici PST-130]KNE92545.1 hypothetical protein PSTG_14054 [Puccinia striiformis f. sp. tritici PST-78]POW01876.1 hypothetical protein PSHT_12343 [Puccinia striiformis]KAH9456265.1 hypothetical protein Pst134EB_012469 [Puccinia striiformis f. sp. tritici]KAH9467869.1 hypothetical protein Pst134EA_011487 [Puccinia striiformis f. sp. tritici]